MGKEVGADEYTQEQLDVAIELATKGESLQNIIDAILTTEYRFHKYRQMTHEFEVAFSQARQEGLEYIADGLLNAHKEEIDVQRGRLKSDNAKWLLAKRKPSVYGDKVDIHVTQTIDISHALIEARSRVVENVIEVKVLDAVKKTNAEDLEVDPFS